MEKLGGLGWINLITVEAEAHHGCFCVGQGFWFSSLLGEKSSSWQALLGRCINAVI